MQLMPDHRKLVGAGEFEAAYAAPPGPYVRANFVEALDGAIEVGGRCGGLGGPADKAVFHMLRATSDVILVGAGTVRAEKYGPVQLDAAARRRRTAAGRAELPRLAIVSASAELDAGSRVLAEGSMPILLTTGVGARRRPDLRERAEVVTCGEDVLEVESAVKELFERGLCHVVCEGGPLLLHSLLSAGLVDELALTISPLLAGGGHKLISGGLAMPEPARLQLKVLLEADGMLFTRYLLEPRG